jgi:(E)-4-hydroxy-3-methylbut-2-enyl-diphosphate synthase
MTTPLPYVASRFAYRRRASLPVQVGRVQVGGGAPLVVQSMCTTPTQDVAATVKQCISLAEVGCEIVRITAPGVKDAQALKDIRREFSAAGFSAVPLVADIHFMPAAAMEAIEHVEKVRINPGNFADKKRFAVTEYTDAEYREEVERVAERFLPLVRRAKVLGRALRIGTNHGSLSDRIMNRFGDSPLGMVESALEFVRIAESEGYRQLIISMKSSNPKVMVQAYRLLVARLDAEKLGAYPLHLGVTEAGDGEDGRTKSAAGIGALLEDGIGDTIRVSLTEAPEAEIPVAKALAGIYDRRQVLERIIAPDEAVDAYAYRRRVAAIARLASTQPTGAPCGGGLIPRVLVPLRASAATGKEPAADARVADAQMWLVQSHEETGFAGPTSHQSGVRAAVSNATDATVPLIHLHPDTDTRHVPAGSLVLIGLDEVDPTARLREQVAHLPEGALLGIAEAGLMGEVRAYRLLAAVIEETFTAAECQESGSGKRHPIVIALPYQRDDLAAAAIAGSLLIDGIGDALYLPSVADPRRLAFTILQAVKARITRADYVACPSCGRTLFDLMEVTAHIKQVTNHLDGVTIAIMGCIVNGPGEMADADFGFVGSGPGKVDLYRGREKVRTGIPFIGARDELVALIKESGKWKDPT